MYEVIISSAFSVQLKPGLRALTFPKIKFIRRVRHSKVQCDAMFTRTFKARFEITLANAVELVFTVFILHILLREHVLLTLERCVLDGLVLLLVYIF